MFSEITLMLSGATVLAFILVMIGTGFQVATGAGLGLIAGPGLLFVLPPEAAIQTSIILNLGLSLLLLPAEYAYFSRLYWARLSLWAAVGVIPGYAFLILIDAGWLKLVCGVVLVGALGQLYLNQRSPQGAAPSAPLVGMKGLFSGIMTGALSIPGPMALWALLQTSLSSDAIRATLRAYFCMAFGLALGVHIGLSSLQESVIDHSILLIPALGLGGIVGYRARYWLSPARLRAALIAMLALMALSLILKGVWDVYAF